MQILALQISVIMSKRAKGNPLIAKDNLYHEKTVINPANKDKNIITDDNTNETNVLNIDDTQDKLNTSLKE